jgi:hypothetical protein
MNRWRRRLRKSCESRKRYTQSDRSVVALAALFALAITEMPPRLLSNPPEPHAKDHILSLTLQAAITSDEKNSFYFNGQPNAPTLRLSPGNN